MVLDGMVRHCLLGEAWKTWPEPGSSREIVWPGTAQAAAAGNESVAQSFFDACLRGSPIELAAL